MAPEYFQCCLDFTASYKSDVYAFGIALYEVRFLSSHGHSRELESLIYTQVISRCIAFKGIPEAAIIFAVGHKGLRPDRHERDALPISNQLWMLMECCWEQEPESRCLMREVLDELGSISRSSHMMVHGDD